jgi:hypothetical protein
MRKVLAGIFLVHGIGSFLVPGGARWGAGGGLRVTIQPIDSNAKENVGPRPNDQKAETGE